MRQSGINCYFTMFTREAASPVAQTNNPPQTKSERIAILQSGVEVAERL